MISEHTVDFRQLSNEFLMTLAQWLMLDYTPGGGSAEGISDVSIVSRAILLVGEARGWPDGWWEDPSAVHRLKPLLDRHESAAAGPADQVAEREAERAELSEDEILAREAELDELEMGGRP